MRRFLPFLGVLLALGATGGFAQSISWSNLGSGNWSASGNWSPNGVPGPTTNVFLTNSAAGSYTVTLDTANASVDGLAIQNLGTGANTLLLNAAGFAVSNNLLVGRRGLLDLNGQSLKVGGLLHVSNVASANQGTLRNFSGNSIIEGYANIGGTLYVSNNAAISFSNGLVNSGTVLISTNGAINVGGTSAAAAWASGVTFTNSGTVTFKRGAGATASSYHIATLNASTNGVGFVNMGILSMASDHYQTGFVNAAMINEVGGTISPGTMIARMSIGSLVTNRGTVDFSGGSTAGIYIQRGDVVNEGTISGVGSAAGFTLGEGALFNATNALVRFSANGAIAMARAVINHGTMILSNTHTSAAMNLGGAFTNYGDVFFYGVHSAANQNATTHTATNILNAGRMVAGGMTNAISANNTSVRFGTGTGIPAPSMTNLAAGTMVATNGAVWGITPLSDFWNLGAMVVHTNSVISLGILGNTVDRVVAGTLPFRNEGTVQLAHGGFGATFLTNAASGTLAGAGNFGRIAFTNVVSASQALTSFVQNVSVNPVLNQGTIAPSGPLNLGAVTNASGAAIVGSGEIQSLNRTNYYSGETLVSTNVNTGGAVANLAGATVLADGGTLALQNGFSLNTQAGTVGTTNGGTLRLGNGTLALTNSGTVTLQGGALLLGSLVNSGSLVGTGALQAASVTSSGTLAPGFSPGTMSFSNDLTLAGSSILNLEIAGTNSADYDRLLVGGAFTQGGTLNVSFLSFTPTGGEVFDLFDFASLAGAFSLTNLPTLSGGLAWDFSNFDTQGSLAITMPIPEPSALSLALLASAGILALRRRREAGPSGA